jgi:3-oxoacyl-[acyl-carrier protein] reductase
MIDLDLQRALGLWTFDTHPSVGQRSGMTDLSDKVGLIVGAGPGIGRACAVQMARAGADLVLAARDQERLSGLATEVAESGTTVLPVTADLADPASCRRLIEHTIEEFERIDMVVNVATLSGGRQTVTELDWEVYRSAFEVNVIGTMEVSRSAATHMATQEGGGSIVQISTLNTHALQTQMAAYSSTKLAMVAASKVLAKELGPQGVRVNIVTPGYTETAPLRAYFERTAKRLGTTPEEVSAQASAGAALRRHVTPDDIAAAVVFLSSPDAANITGIELPVDAGQMLGAD